ncbi:MAG TPA: tetratricopeptide repeat protein [Herpetosiphonaceae bacterium]
MSLSWTPEAIQSLIDSPHELLAAEPWRTWIIAQGGLEEVYAQLSALPLPERERQVLDLLLAEPGLTNIQYAARLNMHRVTFQKALRRLRDALAAHLAALSVPGMPTTPPAPIASAAPINLPMPITTLIGRAHEVALVATWLQDPVRRLITLVGSGGIGKTRLAIQAAWDSLPEFAHGVAFVSLTTITDPGLVLPTIARTLQLLADGGDLAERLQAYLAPRRMCLVIDNAEHLLPAMPLLGRLVQFAPQLAILVTSRVRLGLYGERIIPVAPLSLPPLDRPPPFETLSQTDALRLFADRASVSQPGFELTPDTIALVHAICARLDGLPLSIELAAAQLHHYSLAAILARLGESLAFLTDGPRDADARHQTLLAAIGWSYDLLSPREQLVFRRLGLLVDGWTEAAMLAVCAHDLPAAAANQSLQLLLEHHLIFRIDAGDDPASFGMLETIREYARQQLAAGDEEQALRDRHLAYYLGLAEPTEKQLLAEGQLRWRDMLERAYPNLRAALAWSLESGQRQRALALAASLWRFWYLRESNDEGRMWLERAIGAAGDAADPATLASALQGLGSMALFQANRQDTVAIFQQALAVARQTDDQWRVASILNSLGRVAAHMGEFEDAARHYEESLALRRTLDDPGEIAASVVNLAGLAFREGRHAEAADRYREAVATFKMIGDIEGVAMMLNNLGSALMGLDRFTEAEAVFTEGRAARYQIGHRVGTIMTLINLAFAVLRQGRVDAMRELLRESVGLYQEMEPADTIIHMLELGMYWQANQDRLERALTLYGAVTRYRQLYSAAIDPGEQPWYDQLLARAASELGQPAMSAAIVAGAAMREPEVLAFLLEL